jgi:tRNA-binding protein
MAQHEIDPDKLVHAPEKLDRKDEIGIDGFFAVDMRTGVVVEIEPFPEARKPSYKLKVDFGPSVGVLQTSGSDHELHGRRVAGTHGGRSDQSRDQAHRRVQE